MKNENRVPECISNDLEADLERYLRIRISTLCNFTMTGASVIIVAFCFKNAKNER